VAEPKLCLFSAVLLKGTILSTRNLFGVKTMHGTKQKLFIAAVFVSLVLVLTGCGSSQNGSSDNSQVTGQSVLDALVSGDPASNWSIDAFNNAGSSKAVQVILGDPDCAVWVYANSDDSTYERSAVLYYTPTFSNSPYGGYYVVVAGSSPFSSCVSGALSALGLNSSSSSNGGSDYDPGAMPSQSADPAPTYTPNPFWQPTEKNIVDCINDVPGACDSAKFQFNSGSTFGLSPTKMVQKLVDAGVCSWGDGDRQYFDDSSAFCRVPENEDGFGGKIEVLTGDLVILQRRWEARGGYAIIGKGWLALNETGSLSTDAYDAPMRQSIASALNGHIHKFNQ